MPSCCHGFKTFAARLYVNYRFPQPVQVAVGNGVERAGAGQEDAEARDGRGGGPGRGGIHRIAVRGERDAAELDRRRRAAGNEVQRDPRDVVRGRVGVGDILSDGDLGVESLPGLRAVRQREDGNMLLRLPVGGFDGGSECAHGGPFIEIWICDNSDHLAFMSLTQTPIEHQ